MSREQPIVSLLCIRPRPHHASALEARFSQLLQRTRQAGGCRASWLERTAHDHWLLTGIWQSERQFRDYCEAAAQRDFGPLLDSGLVKEMGFALQTSEGVSGET